MFRSTAERVIRSSRLLVLVGVLALAGCGEQGAPQDASQVPPAGVSIVTVAPETIAITNELPGRIAPTRISEVRPRVAGIVIERVFKQGSFVKQGDLLFRIDPAPFQVRVDSATASLRRADATKLQASQMAERQKALRARAVASDQVYENAVAALAQADADVAAARAGLAAAQLDLQYSEVRAPISGRIGRALITEGALVSATGTESLATIQQLDPIYADFTQSANQLLALRQAAKAQGGAQPGQEQASARLIFDDGTKYAREGKLLFSEAAVDSTTGQVTLRAEFSNPDDDLLPGMYIRVEIVQGEQRNAIVVPQRAVQRDSGGQAQVYVVGAEDRAELRNIAVGQGVGDRWVIDQGLKSGDRVVVEGFQTLSPGATVAASPWVATQNSAEGEIAVPPSENK